MNNPFDIIYPSERWKPKGSEQQYIIAPLVQKIREKVTLWRENDYAGASKTSVSLMHFWFDNPHLNNFRFYFSQRESIESIIYLYDVAKALDKYALISKFDSTGELTADMFSEHWTRYLVKMATGAGKTKVEALVIVWSYFHKLYEKDSSLSKNFLVITPNIIVFNRLLKDFEELKMFFDEPFLPDDGYDDKNWRSDFQPTLHLQDDVKPITNTGNIFLTNIHRVFVSDTTKLTVEETFLGIKPKPDADISKNIDLGKILRSNQIKDLVVINDEAHHVHDNDLQWYKSIEDINNRLQLMQGKGLALQADFTATPKHTNGAIFVQTICDYPLVEAIRQNVVKSLALPDEASRGKLMEQDSSIFTERYKDFLELGHEEWKKQYDAMCDSKKPILFVMTNNTKEADQTADFLQIQYPDLKDAVLTIHTNNKGEISDNSKKDKEELQHLREAADTIDKGNSKYKAVVSVLMLREGWDVRNVTTIVGLRPFKAKSNILPEQTIGRGLRKMFDISTHEQLVVIGTPAFIQFVESLKDEGVEFEYTLMGAGTKGKSPISISIDEKKDKNKLDIKIPTLKPKINREYKNLTELDINKFTFDNVIFKNYSKDELREIIFRDIDDNIVHKTLFKNNVPDYRNVLSYITSKILKESRLISGFNILYPKIEAFVKYKLWEMEVSLSDPQTIRNLSEGGTIKTIYDVFERAIAELTIVENKEVAIKGYASIAKARPIVVKNQSYIAAPKKSLFNKVIGDSELELKFAASMEKWQDVVAYAKNTENGVDFNIEYQNARGQIAAYYTDFLVKSTDGNCYAIELKGQVDDDVPLKRERLRQWCEDVNRVQKQKWYSLFILETEWNKYQNKFCMFSNLVDMFKVNKFNKNASI